MFRLSLLSIHRALQRIELEVDGIAYGILASTIRKHRRKFRKLHSEELVEAI